MKQQGHPQTESGGISLAAKVFVAALTTGAVITLVSAAPRVFADGSPLFLLLAILTVVSAFLAVRIPLIKLGSGGVGFSLADGFLLAGLILLGPASGAALAALEGLAGNFKFRISDPYRFAFNLSHNTLSIYALGWFFYWYLGPWSGTGGEALNFGLRLIIGVLLLGALHLALSSGLTCLVSTLAVYRDPGHIWQRLLAYLTPFCLLQSAVAIFLIRQGRLELAAAALILAFSHQRLRKLNRLPQPLVLEDS